MLCASLRSFYNQHIKVWGPAGLNDYDFHARFQDLAGPFCQSADRHATNTPALSPWTFAAANPVRFTDPTGLDNIDTAAADSTGTAPPPPPLLLTPAKIEKIASGGEMAFGALNAAMGIKTATIQDVADKVTGLSESASLKAFGGRTTLYYTNISKGLGALGAIGTIFNSAQKGYDYYSDGGRKYKVFMKLGLDNMMA